jgi:hypothetical protein
MNSFVLDKMLTQMFSPSSTLFTQNTGGMGRRLRSFTSFTSSTSFASYSSNPAARNFANSVFGDTPNFSEARVLFHLHSRKVLSSSTRSI